MLEIFSNYINEQVKLMDTGKQSPYAEGIGEPTNLLGEDPCRFTRLGIEEACWHGKAW